MFSCGQFALCFFLTWSKAYWPLIHFSTVHLHEYGWFCPQAPVLVLGIVEWFTLYNVKDDTSFLSFSCTAFALLQVQSSSPAHSVATLSQTHPTVMPAPHVFPPCVVVRVFFHGKCLCGLPPFCASTSEHLSHGITDRIWSLITDPHHSTPHAFGDHF